VRAIRDRSPAATFEGIAGPRMQAEGCVSLHPMERLSVMGLFEAAGRYLELVPVRWRLARRFAADPPDVFVGIDAPDFNLDLELALRRAGVPTVHYVSPSVWAWRRYRVRKIARAVDLMLTLLPFEARFYEEHGVPVRFVGHPLADALATPPARETARRETGLSGAGEVVALLPGSRVTEVSRLAGPMLGAAAWLSRRRPGVHFVAPMATPSVGRIFDEARAREAAQIRITTLEGGAHAAMAAADVVLAASGTATLEALLLRRPMVITYRTHALTWRVGRPLLHVQHVGLPNLLSDRPVAPELLQDEATPERLGAAVLGLLRDAPLRRRLEHDFGRIHERLLAGGSNEAAAEAVLGVASR
jgi:lipid-A-disaccharide synthase